MQVLSSSDVNEVSGGIPLLTPVAIALLDTAGWQSVFAAAATGYGIGTLISNNWSSFAGYMSGIYCAGGYSWG